MSSNKSQKRNYNLGAAFKAFRLGNNLTLKEMGKVIDVSSSYLSEVERGLKMPGSQVIITLKRKYSELDLNKLFSYERGDDINELLIKSETTQNEFEKISAFEKQITEIARRIEQLPFSNGAKIQLVDGLIDMIEKDLDEVRRENDRGD